MKFAPLLCSLALLVGACTQKDGPDPAPAKPNLRDSWRVSHAYDYHHRLAGTYIYDRQGRLLRMEHADHISIPGHVRTTLFEFEYENGRAITMCKTSPDEPQFDYIMSFVYDHAGRLTGTETRGIHRDWVITEQYGLDEKGRAYCMMVPPEETPDEQGRNRILSYDDRGDVKTLICHYSSWPYQEGWTTRTTHFAFDAHPKPNFGIDPLFPVEPLPYFGDEAGWQRQLSAHNMTYMDDDLLWEYTYNDMGFPATIQSHWVGCDPIEPLILRLEYVKTAD